MTNETICQLAALQLGLEYKTNINSLDRPAGCYWHEGSSNRAFLNVVVDPSNTNTGAFGNRGGICQTGMLYYYHLAFKIELEFKSLIQHYNISIGKNISSAVTIYLHHIVGNDLVETPVTPSSSPNSDGSSSLAAESTIPIRDSVGTIVLSSESNANTSVFAGTQSLTSESSSSEKDSLATVFSSNPNTDGKCDKLDLLQRYIRELYLE